MQSPDIQTTDAINPFAAISYSENFTPLEGQRNQTLSHYCSLQVQQLPSGTRSRCSRQPRAVHVGSNNSTILYTLNYDEARRAKATKSKPRDWPVDLVSDANHLKPPRDLMLHQRQVMMRGKPCQTLPGDTQDMLEFGTPHIRQPRRTRWSLLIWRRTRMLQMPP